MSGESDLKVLLSGMRPILHDPPYVFCSLDHGSAKALPFNPLCIFREREGVTVIVTQQEAIENALAFGELWACITLAVHSSLQAIGFLAAITAALARADISVNTVSAFYHDHIFVPWESKGRTMDILHELSRSSQPDRLRPESPDLT